jgi:hypothetical protein
VLFARRRDCCSLATRREGDQEGRNGHEEGKRKEQQNRVVDGKEEQTGQEL